MASAPAPLARLLGLPETLLLWAGLALLPYAAALALLGRRERLGRGTVQAVIAGNLAWVAASLALLLWASPTALGYAFVLAQAAAVGGFAEAQLVGLRRSPAAALQAGG
jgi:hypothetical protein